MRKIVLDCETQNTFKDVGSNKPADLDLSLLVIYDYKDEQFHTFFQKDLPQLWRIIEHTDLIIGYNSDHFDIPLLNKYYPGDLTRIPSLDLMVEIKKAYGRALRLDAVAEGTLGVGKSGNGLDAIIWWKNGEYDKIAHYCEQDVRVTRDLYEHARTHGSVTVKDFTGVQDIMLDTTAWEAPRQVNAGINYTLPL